MITREDCLVRAEDCERLASEADTEATREAFAATARKWRALAELPDVERSTREMPESR